MEKKYLYTLKDVIFGLRHIYLEYQRELSKLKEYCKITNDMDFYFFIHQARNENPKLYCEYVECQNHLKLLFKKAVHLISGIDVNENTAIYEDGQLKGMTNKPPVFIPSDKISSFEEQLKRILSSDFISYTKEISPVGIKSLCESGTLYIRTNNIQTVPMDNFALPALFYSPLSDTITLTESDTNFKVSEYGINRIMEMYFFYDQFSDFHLTCINQGAIANKKIIIEPFEPCKKIELGIEEDKESIKLLKK